MKSIESIEVGDIFAENYGSNANQTAFYQVVKRTPKFVDVRRIRATAGKPLDGMDYELIPTADDFMEAEPTRYKIKNWTNNPSNPMPCIMTGYMPAFLID